MLSEAESQAIAQATELAEKKCSADIVTVLVPESDPYPELGLYSAIALWVFVELICLLFPVPLADLVGAHGSLFLPPAAFLLGLALGQCNALRRCWLPEKRAAEEVLQRAQQAWIETMVHASPTRSGILIFVSLFERRALVLADIGYQDKVDAREWEKIVAALLTAKRQGNLGQAVVAAVEACGQLAAPHFPPKEGGGRSDNNRPHLL